MLEPNHRSTKYSNIESKIDNHINMDQYVELKKQFKMKKEAEKSRPTSVNAQTDDLTSKGFRLKGKGENKWFKKQDARSNRDINSADVYRHIKSQLRHYQEKEGAGEKIRNIKQEIFDESEDYNRLEDEYGQLKNQREIPKHPQSAQQQRRLPSAQEHSNFLNRQKQLLQSELRSEY